MLVIVECQPRDAGTTCGIEIDGSSEMRPRLPASIERTSIVQSLLHAQSL